MKRHLILIALIAVAVTACKKDKFNAAEQAKTDEADIKYYIGINKIPAVKDDESPLYYQIINSGSDSHPTETAKVTLAFEISLLDGTQINKGTTSAQPLSGLIEGLRRGIPKIGAGGQIILFIPSALAYGPQGYANIPPNKVLIYKLNLVSFN
ncbi:hypothetical protein EOD41_17735 [Mucilaginibacter limnophilus]|uniref:Peptidyl-prolyl cis-trans isomerase n=1 Tax=Mucilaginibacter limnophilus TaxID=1932778 RepID=A0A437MKR8_9SPHI|nr:FKBP-type peptidyl-prolyl cis-trans isomerase [Mucilaginibacter limnophilus]RVT98213.1 hypothetical protein EOD41_17735 [Mucilaginibacter limnophilus]